MSSYVKKLIDLKLVNYYYIFQYNQDIKIENLQKYGFQ